MYWTLPRTDRTQVTPLFDLCNCVLGSALRVHLELEDINVFTRRDHHINTPSSTHHLTTSVSAQQAEDYIKYRLVVLLA